MFCLATPSTLVDQQDAKGPGLLGRRRPAVRDVKIDPRLKYDGILMCEICQLERVRVLRRRTVVVQWRTQWEEECRGWYEEGWEGLSKNQLVKVVFQGFLAVSDLKQHFHVGFREVQFLFDPSWALHLRHTSMELPHTTWCFPSLPSVGTGTPSSKNSGISSPFS